MVKKADSTRPAPARKPALSRAAAASPAAAPIAVPAHPPKASESGAASVLEAGIKALTLAKERTTSGAGNVVASLMDPFGFRKLEEVFDQRVASALERLGVPSARSLADLVERMEKLCERVEQLEAARRKK